jgi:ribonuclease PH
MQRSYDRGPADPRPIRFDRHFTRHAPGSVLTHFGETRVLCTAQIADGVPTFLQGKGKGWLTAEYGMLPSATLGRRARERGDRPDGRSVEIQRLIGRSLRSIFRAELLGERTIWIDCDVLQADGGTRTAAITGAWVALCDLCSDLDKKRRLRAWPLADQVAALSVGVVDGQVLADLDYQEDSRAQVDMNLVMTNGGRFIEVQGAAEGAPFEASQLEAMLAIGRAGLTRLFAAQQEVLGSLLSEKQARP